MAPSLAEIALRIALAFAAGFLLGWERESHGRPAGLRTNILACVASAIAMIVSQTLIAHDAAIDPNGAIRADPARLAAGVLAGIGFLGAGTILRHENTVRGVTTAATLWFVTILGLAFGTGQYAVGFIGVGTALITLFFLGFFEKQVRSDHYAKIAVTATLDTLSQEDLLNRLLSEGLRVLSVRQAYDLETRRLTMTCEVQLAKRDSFAVSNRIMEDLARCPGIITAEWG